MVLFNRNRKIVALGTLILTMPLTAFCADAIITDKSPKGLGSLVTPVQVMGQDSDSRIPLTEMPLQPASDTVQLKMDQPQEVAPEAGIHLVSDRS